MITVSIVSHGQGSIVEDLLLDLIPYTEVSKIILTNNIPENNLTVPEEISDRLLVIENKIPKGFGANHNSAFCHCDSPYYCVLNPDLRVANNPFPELISLLNEDNIFIVAPVMLNPDGEIEDSARKFPSLLGLPLKALGISDGRLNYHLDDGPLLAPWVAGMFMLFKSENYRMLNGFDEEYFLYYEDVDICARSWQLGKAVKLHPGLTIVHEARRASRKDPTYMRWHAASMARYFRKHLLYSLGFTPKGC